MLDVAKVIALKSKANRLKVGAVITDSKNRILSTGYNGTPYKTDNTCEKNDTTLPHVLHAELNAILFAKQPLDGATLYVTHSPCIHCAACIVQSGITKVIYETQYRDDAGIKFLKENGITTTCEGNQ